MSYINRETYFGYDELVSYLTNYRKKSFWGFLLRYRKVIVSSSMSSSASFWEEFDNAWIVRFLEQAERIDQSNFSILKDKVRFYFARIGQLLIELTDWSRRITGCDNLVTTPSSLFRRLNFVVVKDLLVSEEKLVMHLSLSLNKNRTPLIPLTIIG